jgi:hypothetical protein
MPVLEIGRPDNQCGLALDLAKHLNRKYKGIEIEVHDTRGLNIKKGNANQKKWLQLRCLLKGIAFELPNYETLEIISDDELQLTSHYHALDYFEC